MSGKEALLPTKHIFATNAPFKVRNCAVPIEHLHSEISRLVHGNVIPMGIPWETSRGMG